MTSFVAADLGASETRLVPDNGKIESMPNNMVFIKEETRVDQDPYSDNIMSALDVTIESTNGCEYFPVRVLVGEMADRYSATNERPSVMMNKHKQRINYVSMVLAVAVAKYKYSLSEEISVHLALPPIEVGVAKDIVKKKLVGEYTVIFHKLDELAIQFKIVDVGVYEESFMALMGYFFDMTGRLREEAKKYASGTILSLDIGASTTDLAIVRDMHYLEKSGQTYKTGGNIALEMFKTSIRGSYGFDVPDKVAEKAIAEGRIQMGNTYVDCSSFVEEAKQKLAAQIVEQIQGYFRSVNIPIQMIRAIVVSGGGSMRGSYISDEGELVQTSKAMSEYITAELNEVCAGVQVEQFMDNPRQANIMGLYVRAKLAMMAMLRQNTAQG